MSLELTDTDPELILDALEKDNRDAYSYDRRDRHLYTIKITLIKKVKNEIGSRQFAVMNGREEKLKRLNHARNK